MNKHGRKGPSITIWWGLKSYLSPTGLCLVHYILLSMLQLLQLFQGKKDFVRMNTQVFWWGLILNWQYHFLSSVKFCKKPQSGTEVCYQWGEFFLGQITKETKFQIICFFLNKQLKEHINIIPNLSEQWKTILRGVVCFLVDEKYILVCLLHKGNDSCIMEDERFHLQYSHCTNTTRSPRLPYRAPL